MSAEADKLGLEYGKNPNSLSEPVDAIDALCDLLDPEKGERQLQRHQEPEWLPTHDYTDLENDQPDVEEMEAAGETLRFFIEEDRYDPHAEDFEFQFRAYCHNGEYSYSAATIKRLIASVLGID